MCFSAGGVELLAKQGRIKVVNTLESRLEMMSRQVFSRSLKSNNRFILKGKWFMGFKSCTRVHINTPFRLLRKTNVVSLPLFSLRKVIRRTVIITEWLRWGGCLVGSVSLYNEWLRPTSLELVDLCFLNMICRL